MSLSKIFQTKISSIKTRIKIDEVILFRKLIESLVSCTHSYELHGSKGQVKFNNPANCSSSQVDIQCELCDVAIVSFNEIEVRITFLQAKKGNDKYTPLGHNLSLPVRQHYLLSSFPIIAPVGKAVKLYPKNTLSNKILDSIGSFGVFYKKGKTYDMDYQIANLRNSKTIIPNFKYCSNQASKYDFIGTKNRVKSITISGLAYNEVEGCDNLDSFEIYIRDMLIGDPINASNPLLLSVILKIVKSEPMESLMNSEILSNFIQYFGGKTINYDSNKKNNRISSIHPFRTPIILIDNTKKQ